MARPKPLSQWIIESIQEELTKRTGVTAREIYERGIERYEQAGMIRSMAERRRALRRELPLLAPKGDGDE